MSLQQRLMKTSGRFVKARAVLLIAAGRRPPDPAAIGGESGVIGVSDGCSLGQSFDHEASPARGVGDEMFERSGAVSQRRENNLRVPRRDRGTRKDDDSLERARCLA